MAKKIHKGEICVTQDNHGVIHIELQDGKSRTRCVEIHCKAADFAHALMHRVAPCQFEWCPAQVGKTHEHKEVAVPFTSTYTGNNADREKAAKKALKPFEVDGWVGRVADLLNHNRRVKGQEEQYLVAFHRFK